MARSYHRQPAARARIIFGPAILASALLATAAVSVIAGTHVATRPAARTSSAVTTAKTSGGKAPAAKTPAGSTPAAKTPGWRIVAAFPPVGGLALSGAIAANSAGDAWSVLTGTRFAAVYRWTGKAWTRVPVTGKVTPYVESPLAFDGDSPSDFWLFSSYRRTEALRWTGTTWQVFALPSWVLPAKASGADAAVFGRDDVWVFNLGAGAYAAHYNGHGWAKVRLPATLSEVSAVAADDIWALAGKVALRWNGHAWTQIKIQAAAGNPPESFQHLSATGPKSAWVWRTLLLPGVGTVAEVLHWNGTTWQRVAGTPADIIYSAVPDGAGGLWATGIDINPGGFADFYHLTGGHWTQADNPAGVWNHAPENLTWIPGTRSLWGVAQGVTAKGLDTVILKYGP
jgi:hypothetical protein